MGGLSSHPDDERVLVGGHEHGFIAAVTAAFRDHYPLSLKPQHFWLMIAQAVAVHVSTILITCPLVVMGHSHFSGLLGSLTHADAAMLLQNCWQMATPATID